MGEGCDGRIQNDFICSEVEKVDRDGMWICFSFIVMQEGRAMDRAK